MSDNNGQQNRNDKKDDKKMNPFGDFNRAGGTNNAQAKMVRNIFLWLIIFGTIITIYVFVQGNKKPEWPVTYTQYVSFLNENLIYKATIKKSQLNDFEFHGILKKRVTVNIDGQYREVRNFVTKLGVLDSKTEELWASKGIEWTYEESESPLWGYLLSVLPWILIIGLYIFFMRRMQGGGARGIFSFGKARVKLLSEQQSKATFKDVAGADEAKYELVEIIEFLKEPAKFQRLGGKIPKGVLLLGPPGTGKTLLARAVAGEAGVPFFSMSGADFVEMFVGVGASRVRDLFEQAKKSAPAIVFVDELDAVGRHRFAGIGGGHDEREQTLNQMLVELDGFEANTGIILIAATNRPDVLDPALLRPGRFDRQVVVDRPDVKGREGILKVHTRKIPLEPDVDLTVLAKGTPGLAGAEIANLVNEAALLAARKNKKKVGMEDFEEAKDKVMMGMERKSLIITEDEKKITAYHEIGHVLVAKMVPEADPVHKVTIIPRGRALGVTTYLPVDEKHTYSKNYLEAMITYALGGRAAEKLIFNRFTTGAGNDIEKSTNIARKMVCEWGMSDKLGPIAYGAKEEEIFLGREITKHKDYSEQTAQDIDSELKKIIMDGMKRAEKILSENVDMLHKLSKELLEREILDGDEIDKIMRGEELPPVKRNGAEPAKAAEGEIPDHVQKLIEEKKKKETVKTPESND